jgi:hypothetical protein
MIARRQLYRVRTDTKMRRGLSLAWLLMLVACASIPRASVQPLGPGELAGSGWTLMGALDDRSTGQRIVLDGATIRSVAVPIVPANAVYPTAVVALTIVAADGRVLAHVPRVVETVQGGWVRFPLPGDGLTATTGSVVFLWMSNREGPAFGWRYRSNPAASGGAFMAGRADAQFDFVYQIETAELTATTPVDPVPASRGRTPADSPTGVALPTPRLLARYPMRNDLSDTTGHHPPLVATNAPLDSQRGLFCGGPRALVGDRTCDVRTPVLLKELATAFTIRAQFFVPDRLPIGHPVFVGGRQRRWVAYELRPDGRVRLVHSNALVMDCTVRYRTGTWHQAAITFDGQRISLYLDGVRGCAVDAPIDMGEDRVVLLTNTSNASTFYGFLRDLEVYAGVAPAAAP